jgi:hypothetical protein
MVVCVLVRIRNSNLLLPIKFLHLVAEKTISLSLMGNTNVL